MRRATTNRLVGGGCAAAALVLTAACGDRTCSGFALDLASDVGGQPSPLEAARWFAGHGGEDNVPSAGWHDAGTDETGALVRSGKLTLHVFQGPDHTWQVDSGTTC